MTCPRVLGLWILTRLYIRKVELPASLPTLLGKAGLSSFTVHLVSGKRKPNSVVAFRLQVHAANACVCHHRSSLGQPRLNSSKARPVKACNNQIAHQVIWAQGGEGSGGATCRLDETQGELLLKGLTLYIPKPCDWLR